MFLEKLQQEFRELLAEYDSLREELNKYGDSTYQSYRLVCFTPVLVAILFLTLGSGLILVFGALDQEFGGPQNPGLCLIFETIIFLGLFMLAIALVVPVYCKDDSLSFSHLAIWSSCKDKSITLEVESIACARPHHAKKLRQYYRRSFTIPKTKIFCQNY